MFKNFEIVASKDINDFPPAALSCPPPSKCFLANSFTEKLPFDLNEILTIF